MKAIVLVLMMLDPSTSKVVVSNEIDNVSFNTVKQCEEYKVQMKYTDSKRLHFICK